MTRQEFYEKEIRGINARFIWAIIVCTAVSVSTVLSVYYGLRSDNDAIRADFKLMSLRLDLTQQQVDELKERIKQLEDRK